MSINKVNIAGRVGQDPEMKYLDGGNCVAKFSVAVTKSKEHTNWFNVEVWGKTAETAAEYVKKGSLVGITGSLKFDAWEDRTTGEPRRRHVVTGDRLSLLGSKKQDNDYEDDGDW